MSGAAADDEAPRARRRANGAAAAAAPGADDDEAPRARRRASGAAAAAAPGASSGGGGLGASLAAAGGRAKRALASALLGFALVVPQGAQGLDAGLAARGAAPLAPDFSSGEEDEGGGGGGGGSSSSDYEDAASDGGGGGGGSGGEDGSPPRARRAGSGLRRYGTLKRVTSDDEWAAATEPDAREALEPAELAAAAAAAQIVAAAPPAASSGAGGGGGGRRASASGGPAAPAPSLASSCSCGGGALPPGALNLSTLRGGPAVAWEPPVFGVQVCKEEFTTVASDGWTLHIVHSADRGTGPELARRHPVLLCPGLASSGVGTFDLMPEVSFADFLASKGWDVWCVCLRGNGASDKASKIDVSSWTIDDHLFQDAPAVLSFVMSKTGARHVHWIGHSMGGMLGCGLLSQGDGSKYSEALRSLVMYGSGCFGDGSWHSLLKRIVLPVTKLGSPADLACQGMALLTDKPAALAVFETLFYWFPNVDKRVRKRLLASCFNYIPTTLTGQFLDSHDGPHGLMNVRHTFKYADPEVLADTAVPVLAINGDWDLFCPAAGGQKTVDLFGGPKQALTFGKAAGHSSHYGHFDVIVGMNARTEVWPRVHEFLAAHD